jgi:hypothetical protein
MGKRDPRFDAYIAKSADFAKPILHHLRKIVHKGCPEVMEEMKWSMPHFSHKEIFCGMAAFKQHATFGFWQSGLLAARVKETPKLGAEAMGNFGRLATFCFMKAVRKNKKALATAVTWTAEGESRNWKYEAC